jgi:hypothetical protein
LRPVYDKLAAIMELPLADAKKAEKDLLSEKQLPGVACVLAKAFLPAAIPVRRAEIEQLTRRAMLKAAIAVCENGEAALVLESHKDPSTGVPFQYQKTPNGFCLQSTTLEADGKPITFEVGCAVGR